MTENYTLSDIAAVSRNNDGCNGGFGDGWASWIIIFLIFAMIGWGGYGGFGGYGNGGQGALTRGELCQDMNFADLSNAVRGLQSTQDAGFRNIDNAVCTLGYNNAQLANGIQQQISTEFRGLDNAVCTLGYNNAQLISGVQQQIANCCCENEKLALQNKYDAAQANCATLQAIAKLGDRIDARFSAAERDRLISENAAKDRQILALQFERSQYGQVADIRAGVVNDLRNCPVGTYNVPNPNCCYGPWGAMNWAGFVPNCNNNGGCGCNGGYGIA